MTLLPRVRLLFIVLHAQVTKFNWRQYLSESKQLQPSKHLQPIKCYYFNRFKLCGSNLLVQDHYSCFASLYLLNE
jgi:hypothetical protein